MAAFWGCALCSLLFLTIGVYALCAKKPVHFWVGVEAVRVAPENVKAYNRALGKLWCGFGVVFLCLGLPLLAGQNSALVIVSILGSVFACIFLMAGYMKIEAKFRKK